MSEANAGCTAWENVGRETFEQFVQFAYTGDYSIPKPTFVERKVPVSSTTSSTLKLNQTDGITEVPSLPVAIESPEEELEDLRPKDAPAFGFASGPFVVAHNGWPGTYVSSSSTSNRVPKEVKKKKKVTKSMFWGDEPTPVPEPATVREEYPPPPSPKLPAANFSDLSFPLLAPRNNHEATCKIDSEFQKCHSYSKVFLAHAALYALGDLWLIDSLKVLALHKLHKTLCVYKLDSDDVDDIIDLARYAYTEEGKGFESGVGELRSLICQYMAAYAVELSSNAEFMELLGEGGQFVKDFFKFELQRVH
jgi:hypothetical protein